MGAIVNGFENVPATAVETDFTAIKDPDVKNKAIDRVVMRTVHIYADLVARGRETPDEVAEMILRDDVVAHLRGVAGELIAAELARNPDGVYDGLSHAQLAKVIFYVKPDLFSGLPYAPNAVTEQDIAAAVS